MIVIAIIIICLKRFNKARLYLAIANYNSNNSHTQPVLVNTVVVMIIIKMDHSYRRDETFGCLCRAAKVIRNADLE